MVLITLMDTHRVGNKSKLESALRKIPNSNPERNDLDGALADVKVWVPYDLMHGG